MRCPGTQLRRSPVVGLDQVDVRFPAADQCRQQLGRAVVGVDGQDGVPHAAVALGVVPCGAHVRRWFAVGGLEDGDVALEIAAFEVRVARIELFGRRQLGIGLVACRSCLERGHQCMVDPPAVGAGEVASR